MALRRPSSGALVFLSDRLRSKSQGLRIVALRERTGRSRQMVLHAQDAQLSFSANTWEMIVHGVFPPHEIGEVPRQLSVGSAALADSDIDVMRIDDFQADEIISRSEHLIGGEPYSPRMGELPRLKQPQLMVELVEHVPGVNDVEFQVFEHRSGTDDPARDGEAQAGLVKRGNEGGALYHMRSQEPQPCLRFL